jgi:putative transcriptional regulator
VTRHAKPAKKRAPKAGVGEALIESFSEAVAWARGEVELPVREYHPPEKVEVEPIRRRLGLTQASFARVFGLNIATVRDWEQGRRTPEGPARTLLAVIARHPEIVHEVLSAPRS